MSVLMNSLLQSHKFVTAVVKEGDTVIDATCGNGWDTIFLANLVGKSGIVYSFDIQEMAIEGARKKIILEGFEDRVRFVSDGHQNLDKYVDGSVKAVMFNLGYLPNGDHNIGTKHQTTIEAIERSLLKLEFGGIISIVVYYGGDSGVLEKERVLEFIKTIDCKKYSVMQLEYVNQVNCPPIFIGIERNQ